MASNLTEPPKIIRRWIAVYCLAVVQSLGACAGVDVMHRPDFTKFEKFSFKIDSSIVSFWLPFGGQEGEYTVSEISTPINNDTVSLVFVGYDLLVARSAAHSLTLFQFGLKEGSCCNEGVPGAGASHNEQEFGVVRELMINGQKLIHRVLTRSDGGKSHIYYLPHNESCSLFFALWIDGDAPSDPTFLEPRLGMLREVVESALAPESGS